MLYSNLKFLFTERHQYFGLYLLYDSTDGLLFLYLLFLTPSRPESTYFSKTGNRIGGTYLKALYREFEDDSFTAMKARTGNEEHLGFLGPVIRAEVGDTIEVVFLNDASQPYSIHPSGVHYDKANEGAMYNDGSTGTNLG